jgi:hypothetical protein
MGTAGGRKAMKAAALASIEGELVQWLFDEYSRWMAEHPEAKTCVTLPSPFSLIIPIYSRQILFSSSYILSFPTPPTSFLFHQSSDIIPL